MSFSDCRFNGFCKNCVSYAIWNKAPKVQNNILFYFISKKLSIFALEKYNILANEYWT